MASAEERYRTVQGDMHTLRVGYVVTGATDEDDALKATYTASPITSRLPSNLSSPQRNTFLWRWNIGVEEIRLADTKRLSKTAEFFTYVTYQHRAVCPIPQYDWQTQTTKIYEGYSRRNFPAPGRGEYTNYIGINQQHTSQQLDVQGTDKLVPAGRLNLIWQPLEERGLDGLPLPGVVPFRADSEYMRRCMSMIGKVNSEVFLDAWNPGEVLMTSFNGRQIDQRLDTWEFQYGFEIRQNQTSITIDNITLDDVEGWDYVWGIREMDVKTETPVPGKTESRAVLPYAHLFAEQIYEREDLNKLFYNRLGNNCVKYCPYFSTLDDGIGAFPNAPPTWPSP